MVAGEGIVLVEEFIVTGLEAMGLRASTEEETRVSESVNLKLRSNFSHHTSIYIQPSGLSIRHILHSRYTFFSNSQAV
jgi:hypothetical protein